MLPGYILTLISISFHNHIKLPGLSNSVKIHLDYKYRNYVFYYDLDGLSQLTVVGIGILVDPNLTKLNTRTAKLNVANI